MNDQSEMQNALRHGAEEVDCASPTGSAWSTVASTDSDLPLELGRVMHELQVHLIKLEMQKEDLRQVQQKLAARSPINLDLREMAHRDGLIGELACELVLANEELAFETSEKAKRADELVLVYRRLFHAHEDERKRIAQDLHDSLIQSLCGIRLMGELMIAGSFTEQREATLAHLPVMLTALDDSIEEVRRISMNLHPSMLDDLGLLASLSWLVRNFLHAHPAIKVSQRFETEEAVIPEALRITIFRIVQEAFQNVAKHSQATEVMFSLCLAGGRLTLTVSDNGQGFLVLPHAPSSLHGGLGLPSMQERSEASGGSLNITSHPGKGTQISVSWLLS